MAELQKTATSTFGKLAVFNYNGVPHVGVTLYREQDRFYMRESNYGGDFISERWVYFSDRSLLGFK